MRALVLAGLALAWTSARGASSRLRFAASRTPDSGEGVLEPNGLSEDGKSYTGDVVSREGLGENLPYPSVDFLGVGYNLPKGNPEGDADTQLDPGFRNSVIQLRWDQGNDHLSRDMRYLQPVGGYAFPAYSCHRSSSARQESSSSDYQSSLSVDASVEGKVNAVVASGAFKASVGYSDFSQNVEAKESERFELVSYCLQFVAGFDSGKTAKQEVTAHFANEAKALPTDLEAGGEAAQEDWNKFFDEFGTHYVTRVELGGKMIHQVTIDRSSVEKMRSSSIDIGLAVEAEYGAVSGAASTNVGKSKESKDALASSNSEVRTLVLGGLPPGESASEESAFGAWAATVREAPMPVKYRLRPLSELPGVSEEAYDKALEGYMTSAVTAAEEKAASAPKTPISSLLPGGRMAGSQQLTAPGGKATLQFADDGKLGLLDSHGNLLWTNKQSADKSQCVLEYTTDGDLVVKEGDTVVWESHTSVKDCGGKTPGSVKLKANGNLVVVSSGGEELWSTRTEGMKASSVKGLGARESGCSRKDQSKLSAGSFILQGDRLTSTSGDAYLELEDTGKLTLWGKKKERWHNHVSVDSSRGPFKLVYQKGGDLVVVDKADEQVWHSNTDHSVCHVKGGHAEMQDNGNFVLKSHHGVAIWSTDTHLGFFGKNMDDPEGDYESGCKN